MKRLLCLLLALLLVLPLAVSCSENEPIDPVNTGDSDDTSDVGEDTSAEDTTKARSHSVPVDELDFESEAIHFAAFDWGSYPHYFFYEEEEDSDPMDSAIYARQIAVEEALDVKIEHTLFDGYTNMYAATDGAIAVGDDAYQVILMHQITRIASYVTDGYLHPLETLPYVDLEAEWWNQEQMEILRLGKGTYYAINDFLIPVPAVYFFNKTIAANTAGMPDLYQLVEDYKWTLDAMESAARLVSNDVNTDGVWNANDMYGIGGGSYPCLWLSCGQPITEKGEDGKLQLVMNTERAVDIMDTVARWSKDHLVQIPRINEDFLRLETNQILFWGAMLTSCEKLRATDVDYGILPMPMYDEAQGQYYSPNTGGVMCVPTTIENGRLVGAALELLAFYSAETVVPCFYEVVMDGQVSQDPQTSKMLDIIFDSVCYDPAISYFGLSAAVSTLYNSLTNDAFRRGVSDFASLYARCEPSANAQLRDFYDSLEKMEEMSEYFE